MCIYSLSLGADYNQVANDAIAQAVSLGIHVVVAGNLHLFENPHSLYHTSDRGCYFM